MNNKKNIGGWLKYILASLMLIPALAQAQNLFEPVPGSKAMEFLRAMFGGSGVFGYSLSADAFGGVIEVLNGSAMIVGGILIAYTIFAGTLGTASDGEMLGKKFSSTWLPIRTAMGAALVLPIGASGYCVMQMIVGWLIVQGVGMGDAVWTAYTSSANLSATSTVGLQKPQASELGYTAFQSLVCVEAMKKVVQDPNNSILNAGSNFGTTIDDGTLTRTYYFGDKAEMNGFKKDSCGTIEVSKWQAPTLGPSTGGIVAPFFNAKDSFGRTQEIVLEHQNQVSALIASLQASASTLVATKSPLNTGVIDQAIANYESAVGAKSAEVIKQMDAFKEVSENASKDGWVLAGAYLIKISSITDMVHRSQANVPTAKGPSGDFNRLYTDEYATYLVPLYKTLEKAKQATGVYAIGNQQGGSNEPWFDSFKGFVTGGLDVNVLLKKIFSSSTNMFIGDNEHPILAMKRMGDNLINLAGLSILGKGLVAMGVLGNMPGVGLVLQTATMLFAPPILIAGVLLAYVLPWTPFMMWMGVFVGWLLLCVQAMIAAPIWAVMHLHPSGDDLTGKAGNGYNLVLSLLLRPMLMVLGLIASITILNLMGQLYNRVFADVFISTQQDSNAFIWIIGMLMSGLIYCYGMWTIIQKTFSIMHELPDQIIEWFGQSSNVLGKSAQEVGNSSGVIAGAQVASNMTNAGLGLVNKKIDDGQKQISNDASSAMSLDKNFGTGTSDLFNKINGTSNNEGLSSLDSVKQQAMMGEAIKMLGGKDSHGGLTFMERMKQSAESNPGMSFNEHVHGAMSKGLSDKYGDKTLETAFKTSFGANAEISNNNGQLFNPEFKRAVSAYGAVYDKLAKNGESADSINTTISSFNAGIESAFAQNTNPAKEYKHYFSDALKTFRN